MAFFPCQSSCEGSCSDKPVLFVHVGFILPALCFCIIVTIYLKGTVEKRTFLQMTPAVE